MPIPRRSLAVVAALALLGLGISAAFLLPSSSASGAASYTYPTKPPPTKTTTHETTTHESQPTTTEETPATTGETTLESTTTVSTSVVARVRMRSNPHLHATLLVDQGGMTLYHFIREKAGHIRCTGGCASVWPPLLVGAAGKAFAGLGINRLRLGKVRRPDGRMQVTYAGLALYRFSGDTKPGDAKGQGFGHVWFAVRPSGLLVSG